MARSLGLAMALVLAAPILLSPPPASADDRGLPMRFDLRLQGPADACGSACKTLISAAGAITPETARDFKLFAQAHNLGNDLRNATVVLDSDGGSVIGAIALGREIRRLALTTMVGRTIDIAPAQGGEVRATLSPRGDCESMCAFVMLGGVHRIVPSEARVMVHQIWLGDRRDDPTAANYSAEDMVLVQRDIGRLAQYTTEMGASIELLDIALRIPPWEPMHSLTAEELGETRLITVAPGAPVAATAAAAPPAASQPAPRVTSGLRAAPISDRRWGMVDRAGTAALARSHPLTVEGETIGSFDLLVSCGASGENYDVSYIERRRGAEHMDVPNSLDNVNLRLVSSSTRFKVVSSERRKDPDELVTYAIATVSAARIGRFAGVGNHSMVIETQSDGMVTVIRLGNTGAQADMPQLAASCIKGTSNRAELSVKKTGGYAAAQ